MQEASVDKGFCDTLKHSADAPLLSWLLFLGIRLPLTTQRKELVWNSSSLALVAHQRGDPSSRITYRGNVYFHQVGFAISISQILIS